MPIKGLTDDLSLIPRFPRIGKLRKGDVKTDPKKPGADLEYFRFTSDRPEVLEAFISIYGEQPKSVNIFLPFVGIHENFSTWREAWRAGGLVHRCDGETMVLWLENGKYRKDPKPCPGGCTEIGRLTMVVPELVDFGYIGYVELDTGSSNDIISIARALRAMWETRQFQPEGLRGVPFILRRVPETISTPGWGDNKDARVRTKKYLVKLDLPPDWVRTMLAINVPRASIQDIDRQALPAGQRPSLGSGVQEPLEIQDAPDGIDANEDTSVPQDNDFVPAPPMETTFAHPAPEPPPDPKAKSAGEAMLEKERALEAAANSKAVKAAERFVTAKGTSFAKLTQDQCLDLVNFYRNAKKEKGTLIQVDEDKYHACLTLYRVKFNQPIPPE